MAFQSIWYFTGLPEKVIDIIEEDLRENFEHHLEESRVGANDIGVVDKTKRNCKNSWIPSNHWIAGFIWHYVQRANRENFLYDLGGIDGESLQYTLYGPGEYYGWHTDGNIETEYKPMGAGTRDIQVLSNDFVVANSEVIRKLSFSLLLSNPDDYEGGNFQFMDSSGKSYFAPRQRGTIILFDSRLNHRVQKVTKGVRKSIVGWTVGPRWK
jgi:predicted 2-oxoglutarate/Fe(II)-dependent dioxygenase YbiX